MTYEELIDTIEELRKTYNAFAVAIDGMTSAGKTTLAAHLSKKYGAPVIHLSDFLLPKTERKAGWEDTPAGEVDFERFDEEIVTPWMEKKPLVYSVVDPASGELIERRALPDGQMFLIEGTYCLHPCIRDFYDLRLFLRIDAAEQTRRLTAGGKTPDTAALARENAYFVTYMTDLLSDGVLEGDIPLPDPASAPAPESAPAPAKNTPDSAPDA